MVYTILLAQALDPNSVTLNRIAPSGPSFWKIFLLWAPAILGIAFWGLLAFCIYRAAKYFSSSTREQKLLRMEMGKLVEDVRLLRQEMTDGKDSDSSAE